MGQSTVKVTSFNQIWRSWIIGGLLPRSWEQGSRLFKNLNFYLHALELQKHDTNQNCLNLLDRWLPAIHCATWILKSTTHTHKTGNLTYNIQCACVYYQACRQLLFTKYLFCHIKFKYVSANNRIYLGIAWSQNFRHAKCWSIWKSLEVGFLREC